jgi:leucyl-tRNA---protein transferase
VTDQALQFPRFFMTGPSPCPYLPGRVERKVFTELKGREALGLHESLSRIGFRRSQTVAYRPSCEGCSACVSVRVLAQSFQPTGTYRRTLKRNADLQVAARDPWATEEQFDLLKRYLRKRHPIGGMSDMDVFDYADMIERTPVHSTVVEYRVPDPNGRDDDALVAVCLTDLMSDGLSMVYSFYDPECDRPGLGTFMILDHIQRAALAGLPYVYLGYWIRGSRRMDYKVRFRPLEILGPDGWTAYTEDD